MRILAIETSCDETGVAILEGTKTSNGFSFNILSAALLSQAELHAPYGGVYPNIAKREHQKNLPIIFEQALTEAGVSKDEIDAIAVTSGPGLEPALWQGVEFAKKLSEEWEKPLLPVNHMEAHLLSSLVREGKLEDVQFPVLALLISGGHTEFVEMKDWFDYAVIGQTVDDAVGECFDKVARMLSLPYPGGPQISKLADQARAEKAVSKIQLPRPMMQSNNCDVSFSGLKTAALYALREVELSQDEKAAFAAEFETAVADVFVSKTRRALIETQAQTFVIGGGVAANRYIRERLQALVLEEFSDVEFRLPEIAITGDNAVMIAQCALTHLLAEDWEMKTPTEEIRAMGNLALGKKVL